MASKPITFDPNQPFEEEGSAAPVAFDPNQAYEEASVEDLGPTAEDVFAAAANIAGGRPVAKPAPTPTTGNPLQDLAIDAAGKFSENIDKQGGWGLAPETRQALGADGPVEFLRPLTNLPANIADAAFRAYQATLAGVETAAQEVDRGVDATGINDTRENPIHPGGALMALAEAFPLAGAEIGGLRPSAPRRLTPQEEAQYIDLLNNGTVSDIHEFIGERNLGFKPGEVERYVEARDANKPVSPEVRYQDGLPVNDNRPQIPQGEIKFDTNRPYTEEEGALADRLIAERQAFEPSHDPTPEELFAPKAKATPEEFQAKLEDDAAAFLAKKGEEAAAETDPVLAMEAKGVSDHVAAIEAEVEKTAKGWKGAPDFEVINSLDDIEDPKIRAQAEAEGGNDALGFLGPDGRVRIIASNIRDASEVPAVVYHEALGHHGLVQKFGQGLDDLLVKMYNSNRGEYRAKVDQWLNDHPGEYTGEGHNRIARAFDEVLAEESEAGRISPKVVDVLMNYIKGVGRKMGLDMAYSDREIFTILGMAHDATVKGLPGARANGFRYARPKLSDEDSRALIEYSQAKSIKPSEVERLMETDPQVAADIKARADQLRNQERARQAIADQKEGKIRYARRRRQPNGEIIKPGEVNLNNISTVNDVDDLVKALSENYVHETKSHEQIIREARQMEMTPAQVAKAGGVGNLSAKIHAYQRAQATVLDNVAATQKKLENGYSPSLHAKSLKDLAQLEAVYHRVRGDTSEVGRALNAMKIIAQSNKKIDIVMKELQKRGGAVGALTDPDTFMKFMKGVDEVMKAENPEAFPTLGHRVKNAAINILNIPRSLMASIDFSAPFRQGILLVNRKEFWGAWGQMFKSFGSERAFKALQYDIEHRPTYPLMEEAGLAVSELGGNLRAREEAFMSQWAEKIPVIGRGVRASERAYVGFLNKVRADTFDSLVKLSEKAGVDFEKDPKALKDIASFVNNATGRGSLGSLAQSGPLLNSIFFSPRLIASRVRTLNPAYYATLSPVVRKEAIKSLLSFGALALTITGLAKLAGADVESDPRSSDFGKIRVGNTRWDIGGGYGQYITLGARLVTNETKNIKGEVKELGKDFPFDTRLDVAGKFATNKFSPVASFAADYLRGTNAVGEPFDLTDETVQRFIPLFVQDAASVVEEEGLGKGLAMASPGIFGVGVQTFDTREGVRQISADAEGDPEVDAELKRLAGTTDKAIVAPPRRSFTINGDKYNLSDEKFVAYRKKSAELFRDKMKELLALPKFREADDKVKRAAIKALETETREAARIELLESGVITKDDIVRDEDD